MGLRETVKLAGAQPEVRPFLVAADIGLLTSRSEGCSNSLLEYLAMGLPAIVSDVPANHELVAEVFFEPGNSSDLAHKILRLWGCPEDRERLGRNYRERVAAYGLDALARRAQSYYVKLAAEHL